MATSTFSLTGIPVQWTLLVDGATYQRFGVQLASTYRFDLAIASAMPEDETLNCLSISRIGSREFSEEISSGDKVWVRTPAGESGASQLRGYRVTR